MFEIFSPGSPTIVSRCFLSWIHWDASSPGFGARRDLFPLCHKSLLHLVWLIVISHCHQYIRERKESWKFTTGMFKQKRVWLPCRIQRKNWSLPQRRYRWKKWPLLKKYVHSPPLKDYNGAPDWQWIQFGYPSQRWKGEGWKVHQNLELWRNVPGPRHLNGWQPWTVASSAWAATRSSRA